MTSKKINNLSIQELHQRWRDHIEWIGEEVNYMVGHRIRYRLIEKWLFRPLFRRWVNRHLQAFGWISGLWFTEGLMSVRRQLDGQYGSISLKHLLHEIEGHPEVPLGLSASEVTADRLALEQACAGALEFAQRQVAHRVPWDDHFDVFLLFLDRYLYQSSKTPIRADAVPSSLSANRMAAT